MAEQDIIQNMILRNGQSQDERPARELGTHFADVDERSAEDLMRFTRKFASFVNYYHPEKPEPDGTWEAFFPGDAAAIRQALENKSGNTQPHLALFLTFLELYKKPQEIINRITGQHLDFYFKDVLRLEKKSAQADRAHILLELKKNAPPLEISPRNLFTAGKDMTGTELIYAPTGTTIINTAGVDSLRSVFLDARGHGTVRCAPIANSSDGVGGELQGVEPKWYGFGHRDLPGAEVGFAVSSPVLRMKEGVRKITVTLALADADSSTVNTAALSGAFEAFITGEENWIGPFSLSPVLTQESDLNLEFTVPESEKAVVDYKPAVHGYAYAAGAPVIQVLLKQGNAGIGYNDFRGIKVKTASVSVTVSNISAMSLESDGGTLDPKKAFMPFGPQPARSSRFLVGHGEALSKKLSEIAISVTWKNAPGDFSSHYGNYLSSGSINNNYFTASVSFKDGGSWVNTSSGVALFKPGNTSEGVFKFVPGTKSGSPAISEGMMVHALHFAGSAWSIRAANKYVLKKPVFKSFKTAVPETREGFITFSLEKDFLHSAYRSEHMANVMKYSKEGGDLIILNEPYTPVIQSITLSYKAHSDKVSIASDTLEAFSNNDVHFFHISYFGQMREHGYQRQQLGFLAEKSITLLPDYRSEGELIIGFKDLKAGDSVSVLFHVAEGSDDPDLDQEDITWFVLCDNYWKPLGTNELPLDTTNQLLTSGIIAFVIPAEATLSNTILPAGRIWVKAAVKKNVAALCQLVDITANAVDVEFTDNGNDPEHLRTVLEKGKIAKLKNGLSSVKSVKQKYASFGGRPAEPDDSFYTRVSERLRHKNRCITAWDYERTILEAFPAVYKVKCIPHSKDGRWLTPGNVLIVAIPDLRNKNAIDFLQPKLDADTIDRITSHVRDRSAMQVSVKVKNPLYQKVRLEFKVKFMAGKEFNYYSNELNQALIRFLSPWAYEPGRGIAFGGIFHKSVLLDFVEEQEYVDYIEDFKMYTYTEDTPGARDVNEARAATPDAILVSEKTHIINKAG